MPRLGVAPLCLALWACACGSPRVVSEPSGALLGQPSTSQGDTALTPLPQARWDEARVRYTLALEPLRGSLRVTMRVLRPPAELPLELPSAWGGLQDLDLAVRDLEARCPGGELEVVGRGEPKPTLRSRGCDVLEVTYGVAVRTTESDRDTRLGRLWPRLTPERALLYGQAALARPVWAEAREVAVEIWAPPRWSVATSWPQVALDPAPPDDPQAPRRVWRFWAEDLGHLEDSFVAGGTNLRLDARPMDDGRLLLVATQGPLPLSHDALMEAAARFLVVQRRYVPQGWAWPAGTRQVSVLALGHEGDLLEGAGRRGGVVLELGAKAKRADTLELVAHELFHTLNGHLLVHSAYAERDTLWFKEGVTSYVAAVSVVRAGYEEEGWFLERVGAWASDLRGNPWQGQPAAKLHEAQGRQDAAALRLPYDRGALVGLLLDAALWDEATGQGGLERLMGWLLSSFAARGASYDEPALREGVVALLGEAEGGRLWEAHLSGTSPLPLDEILGRLGLGLREATVPAPYFGLVLGEDQRGWFVVHVEPRSPAAKAGLGVGDRLAGQPNLPTQRIASAHLEVIHPSGTWTAVLDPEPGQRAVSRVAPTSGGGAVWRRLIGR